MYTDSLNVTKSCILPTELLYILYVSQKKTMKFFLYSINWLVFITEEASVYCAVRTGSLTEVD
jgi:hypothetical protein